jgi:hypothetical protein
LSEKPVDLSRLDSFFEERSERMAGRIMMRCAAELMRRRSSSVFTFADGLLAWSRPALAVAAALAVVALVALAKSAQSSRPLLLMHATALPPAAQQWLLDGASPLVVDVFARDDKR